MTQHRPSDQARRPERVGPYVVAPTAQGVTVRDAQTDQLLLAIPTDRVAEVMAALGRAGISAYAMANELFPPVSGRAA